MPSSEKGKNNDAGQSKVSELHSPLEVPSPEDQDNCSIKTSSLTILHNTKVHKIALAGEKGHSPYSVLL